MTVHEIVKEWLTAHGFTGLVDEYRECGCCLEDLAPCMDGPVPGCEAGYKVPCTPECDHGVDPRENDWHIQLEKPKEG